MTTSAPFCAHRLIRFSDTDPAGIVYYPNYFDMFHSTFEDWFTQCLDVDYAEFIMRRRIAFPAVHVESDFIRPCRMGETLEMTPLIDNIGHSSLALTMSGRADGTERLRGKVVVACISLDTFQTIAIPNDLRKRLEAYRQACLPAAGENNA